MPQLQEVMYLVYGRDGRPLVLLPENDFMMGWWPWQGLYWEELRCQ